VEFAKSAVNWGSVPDWIAGIGSVLAFLGLVAGLLIESAKRRKDEARRVQDEARRKDETAEAARTAQSRTGGTVPAKRASSGLVCAR
jgi:hypothetical protein